MPNEYSESDNSSSSDGTDEQVEKDEEILPEIRESLEERVQEVLGDISDESEPIVQISS